MKSKRMVQLVQVFAKRLSPALSFSLLFCAALALAGVATAAPIAYDDLEGSALGQINLQSGGTGFIEPNYAKTNAMVVNGALSYSNGDIQCSGGTNCLRITNPDTQAVLTRAIGTQDGDYLYLSFLFNTPTADGSANEDFLSFGFNTTSNETTAGVVHRFNSTSTDHAFGIRTNASEARGTINTTTNQTYFLVFRMHKLIPGASQNYNELSLFVNPSSMYEATPTMVVTNNAQWAAATHIAARIASSEAGDTYYLDNLCVGATYNSVAYPAGNSPVTDQPVVTPRSGTILGQLTVSMSTPTAGATIRYTTDGSTPSSTSGTIYTAPFVMTASARVKAIAYIGGKYDSAVTITDYAVQTHWIGGGANSNWSTVANWSPAVSPVGTDVMFDNTATNKNTATNNIVDANMTISSLSYTNSGNGYHVTQIGAGVTLTVDGSTTPANALFVGRTATETATTYTYVKMIGGGNLAINAARATGLVTKNSDNQHGEARLDVSGLGVCSITVSNLVIGRLDRASGFVTLATNGVGSNCIVAARLGVGDSEGGANGDASELNLGRINVLNVDSIGVGAAAPGGYNQNSGTMRFQVGMTNGTVVIRGSSGGSSRADLTIGGHGGTKTVRNIGGNVPFTNGTVDAMLGNFVLADARGYWTGSGGIGTMNGTLSLAAGTIDAATTIVGRTLGGSGADGRAGTSTGTLNVNGGRVVAGSLSLADDNSGTAQNVAGNLNIGGTGTVAVAGNLTLGTMSGTASGIVATVTLNGGALNVAGNMAPGGLVTGVVSTVVLNGGNLTVTNGAASATLQIERGTLALTNGMATVDRLVMTNALAAMQVQLRGKGDSNYGRVIAGSGVLLGGALTVTVSNYTVRAGDSWTIVGGTGTRTGAFATTNLPAGMKVFYTSNGFAVGVPPMATSIFFR